MKLFAYALREYDELGYLEDCAKRMGFEYEWTPDYPCAANVGLAAGADCLSIITNPLDASLLDRFYVEGVRYIATRSIGYEHIDVAHARGLGMRVAHAAYPPEGVADYAIMLMMMALRKVRPILSQAATQDFTLKGKIGRDLGSCTVGVVGTGRIGETVVRHLQGFGCEILASDPYPKASLEEAGLCRYVSLDELLASSDVVTLHAPALESNIHMIGSRELGLMREDAVLVNCARGSLVDTDALLDALEQGRLAGAALDTIENEAPLYYRDLRGTALSDRSRAALLALPNVIVSPHMAFYTEADVRGMLESTCSALAAFAAGGETPYEVPASA